MAYQRVNWQSGTKVADGYVEINGTKHTTVQPQYSGSTPINPTSLNIMDEGIEENSKLLNGKLTVEEITLDKIELKNKFNKKTVVEDSIIDLDGSVVSGKSGWCASDFIPVKANTKYVYQGITNQGSEKYSAYYDSNKQFISYFTQETGFNKRITTPDGTCYVRFSMLSSNKEDFQLELGEWSTEYTPYKELIDSDYIKGVKPMESITVENIKCKNMINKNTFTLSYTYDSDGRWTFNDKNAISDYMEIESNKSYTISSITSPTAIVVHYFNSSKQWQERAVYQNVNEIHITNTNNYSYIRISFNYDDTTTVTQSIIDNIYFQVEEGDVATRYVEYQNFGIQNGSDLNGSWTKFDDGTLIYRKTISKENFLASSELKTTVQGIDIFRSEIATLSLTLNFIDTNYTVSIAINNDIVGSRAMFPKIHSKDTNAIRIQLIGLESFTSSGVGYANLNSVDVIAIGRWK